MLGALPRRRFDTAYVESRRVHVAIPQIEWRGVHYSVPPKCLGQKVEVRHEVDSSAIEIRWAGEVVGRHTVADPSTGEVWEATHWQAAQEAALSRSRGTAPVRRAARRTTATRFPCVWTSRATWTSRSPTSPAMRREPGRDQLPL